LTLEFSFEEGLRRRALQRLLLLLLLKMSQLVAAFLSSSN
jgi:hypothetical protein